MRTFASFAGFVATLIVGLSLAGCESDQDPKVPDNPPPLPNSHAEHPTEGPHHGDLIELGDEAFHAELVHDESDTVTIYILDSSAQDEVSIAEESVTST